MEGTGKGVKCIQGFWLFYLREWRNEVFREIWLLMCCVNFESKCSGKNGSLHDTCTCFLAPWLLERQETLYHHKPRSSYESTCSKSLFTVECPISNMSRITSLGDIPCKNHQKPILLPSYQWIILVLVIGDRYYITRQFRGDILPTTCNPLRSNLKKSIDLNLTKQLHPFQRPWIESPIQSRDIWMFPKIVVPSNHPF